MIDLTKITFEQANKIECALYMMEETFIENIEVYRRLANDEGLSAKTRDTMKSNAEWWQGAHDLIYGKEKSK